jgi:hypothetical protein
MIEKVIMFFSKLLMDSYGMEHLLKMIHHTMHSLINVLNLWVKLEGCRKHDIFTIVVVMWFSLNFPFTYFVSIFISVSNRIGPLSFDDTSNLQGLLRTLKCRYLSMEHGSLFCFVLHVEISQIIALPTMLLVSLKNFW